MTIIVSVKINDGIVMATDSAASFDNGMTYQHAIKIVNLVKGIPIGAMVTGDGGIGRESIDTLFKDLRRRFEGKDPAFSEWEIDPDSYTMEGVANRLKEFIWSEKIQLQKISSQMLIRICGYSAGRPSSELWDLDIRYDSQDPKPVRLQAEENAGMLWAGQCEAMNRLVEGMGSDLVAVAARELGATVVEATDAKLKMGIGMYKRFVLSGMPIQDAIELAKFMVQTTIGFVKFSIDQSQKNVGGPIEIAVITKHEGFKWIQRKHFYPAELN